jgi:hypothetical protein
MAKGTDRLTQKEVEHFKGPGVLHDGRGLYLHVGQRKTDDGPLASGKNWLLRYQIDGKARWMGLGSYPEIGLARAREKALDSGRPKAIRWPIGTPSERLPRSTRHALPRLPSPSRRAPRDISLRTKQAGATPKAARNGLRLCVTTLTR